MIVLWIVWKAVRGIWFSIRAPRGGWRLDVVEEVDGSHWKQGIWVRKRPNIFTRLKRRLVPDKKAIEEGRDPDVLVVDDERRPLIG